MITESSDDGKKRLCLSKEQFLKIDKLLQDFYQLTKCTAIALCDISGLMIAHNGVIDKEQVILLSALAAGNYASTNEIAKLIGERRFQVQLYEGDLQNICISGLDENGFLLITFGESNSFEGIRQSIATTSKNIVSVLQQSISRDAELQRVTQSVQTEGFEEELSSCLDRILSTK